MRRCNVTTRPRPGDIEVAARALRNAEDPGLVPEWTRDAITSAESMAARRRAAHREALREALRREVTPDA